MPNGASLHDSTIAQTPRSPRDEAMAYLKATLAKGGVESRKSKKTSPRVEPQGSRSIPGADLQKMGLCKAETIRASLPAKGQTRQSSGLKQNGSNLGPLLENRKPGVRDAKSFQNRHTRPGPAFKAKDDDEVTNETSMETSMCPSEPPGKENFCQSLEQVSVPETQSTATNPAPARQDADAATFGGFTWMGSKPVAVSVAAGMQVLNSPGRDGGHQVYVSPRPLSPTVLERQLSLVALAHNSPRPLSPTPSQRQRSVVLVPGAVASSAGPHTNQAVSPPPTVERKASLIAFPSGSVVVPNGVSRRSLSPVDGAKTGSACFPVRQVVGPATNAGSPRAHSPQRVVRAISPTIPVSRTLSSRHVFNPPSSPPQLVRKDSLIMRHRPGNKSTGSVVAIPGNSRACGSAVVPAKSGSAVFPSSNSNAISWQPPTLLEGEADFTSRTATQTGSVVSCGAHEEAKPTGIRTPVLPGSPLMSTRTSVSVNGTMVFPTSTSSQSSQVVGMPTDRLSGTQTPSASCGWATPVLPVGSWVASPPAAGTSTPAVMSPHIGGSSIGSSEPYSGAQASRTNTARSAAITASLRIPASSSGAAAHSSSSGSACIDADTRSSQAPDRSPASNIRICQSKASTVGNLPKWAVMTEDQWQHRVDNPIDPLANTRQPIVQQGMEKTATSVPSIPEGDTTPTSCNKQMTSTKECRSGVSSAVHCEPTAGASMLTPPTPFRNVKPFGSDPVRVIIDNA